MFTSLKNNHSVLFLLFILLFLPLVDRYVYADYDLDLALVKAKGLDPKEDFNLIINILTPEYERFSSKAKKSLSLNDKKSFEDVVKALSHAYVKKSDFYFEKNDNYNAKDAAIEAIKINNKSSNGYNNLALAYEIKGKHNEAIELYDKALEINKDDPVVNYNIGITYYNLGNYEKAFKHISITAKLTPNYSATQLWIKHLKKKLNQ